MTTDNEACDVPGDQGPDYDEALQLEETPMVRVPVELAEPLTVRIAPGVDGQVVTRTAGTAEAVKLAHANPLRRRTVIVAADTYYLGFSKSVVEANVGQIPANTPIEMQTGAELWAKAAIAETYVTLIAEHWAH
jgi:hypothetical protein